MFIFVLSKTCDMTRVLWHGWGQERRSPSISWLGVKEL